MSLAGYAKERAGELVLLLVCVWALETLVMDGFYVDEGLQFGPVPLAVSAVLLSALYLSAFKQRFWLAGGVVVAVLVVGVFAGAMALSGNANAYADEYGNWFWAAVVVVAVTVGGFLLTRTLTGAGIWFVVCVFSVALVQMLFETGRLPYSLLVLLASLGLLVFCNFRIGQASVDSATGTSSLANFALATIPTALLIGIACAVWFGLIAPLNPPVVDAHLITEYRKESIEQVRGVGNVQMQVDTSMTSDQLVEGDRFTTDDLVIDESADKAVEAKAAQEASTPAESDSNDESGGADADGESAGARDKLDRDSPEDRWDAMSYTEHIPWVVFAFALVLLLFAAFAAYFVLRRLHRRRRLENMVSAATTAEQVGNIYRFLMGKLALVGFAMPSGATLEEFSSNAKRSMGQMRLEIRVPFEALTDVYQKVTYGAYEPTEEEVVLFVAFYERFWKAARKQLGNVRYFFRSFKLG